MVLGYLASLGVTELVFKSLHTAPEPWVGLDWKVGFFLFVILVAVGEDYNIFLMARVIEEEREAWRHRGNTPGRRPHRRDHQLVRPDHGRHVRLDAHRQPDLPPRAGIRPWPGCPARHVPRPPDPRPRIRRGHGSLPGRTAGRRSSILYQLLPMRSLMSNPSSLSGPNGEEDGDGRLRPEAIDSCLGQFYEDS